MTIRLILKLMWYEGRTTFQITNLVVEIIVTANCGIILQLNSNKYIIEIKNDSKHSNRQVDGFYRFPNISFMT